MAELRATLAGFSEVVNKLKGNSNVSQKNKESLTSAETDINALVTALLKDNTAKEQATKAAQQEIKKLKKELKKKMVTKSTNDNAADADDNNDTGDDHAAFMLIDKDGYNQLTTTVDKLQAEVLTLTGDKKNFKNAMHVKNVEIRALQTTINKGKTDLASSKEALKDKGYEHQVNLDEKAQQAQDQTALVGRMRHEAKVQGASLLESQTELRKSKDDLKAVQGLIQKREFMIQQLQRKGPEKEQEITRLEVAAARATEAHKTTVDDLEERRKKLAAEKTKLAEESDETIRTIKGNLDEVKTEKAKLEEEVKKVKEKLEQKENQVEMLWDRVTKVGGGNEDGAGPAGKRPRTEG